MNRISPSPFLARRGSVLVLDVRSPAEYRRGHIPGSLSLPLFDDEERARVGTTYAHDGHNAAVLAGLGLVGPKLAEHAAAALALDDAHNAGRRHVALTCWRGGMRSAAMGWLLEQVGFSVTCLHGGYKAYRRHVLDSLAASRPLLVLAGMTGAGKTDVLAELNELGSQVLDLEDLAVHRGSAFGAHPDKEQPGTEHFENLMADALTAMDPERPVWLEDECQNLGTVNIPKPFFAHMNASPVVRLDVPRADRTARIVRGYDPAHNSFAVEGLDRIRKRLGSENHSAAREALAAGDYARVTDILLDYYDKAYAKQLAGRPDAAFVLTAAPGETPRSLAEKLRAWELAKYYPCADGTLPNAPFVAIFYGRRPL